MRTRPGALVQALRWVELPMPHLLAAHSVVRRGGRSLPYGAHNQLVEPRHVPRVLDADQAAAITKLINPSCNLEHFRHLCALAIVRSTHGGTWQEAGKRLGVPRKTAQGRGNHYMAMASGHPAERIREELDSIARELAQDAIDYRAHEHALAQLHEVPEKEWNTMVRRPVARGFPLRRDAAGWLWVNLVHGFASEAPGYIGRSRKHSARFRYRRFDQRVPPYLQLELLNWCARTYRLQSASDGLHPGRTDSRNDQAELDGNRTASMTLWGSAESSHMVFWGWTTARRGGLAGELG